MVEEVFGEVPLSKGVGEEGTTTDDEHIRGGGGL